MNIEVFQSMV